MAKLDANISNNASSIVGFVCYRIDRTVLESAGLAYRAAGGDTGISVGLDTPPWRGPVPYPPTDPPLILKYLKGQVCDVYIKLFVLWGVIYKILHN